MGIYNEDELIIFDINIGFKENGVVDVNDYYKFNVDGIENVLIFLDCMD